MDWPCWPVLLLRRAAPTTTCWRLATTKSCARSLHPPPSSFLLFVYAVVACCCPPRALLQETTTTQQPTTNSRLDIISPAHSGSVLLSFPTAQQVTAGRALSTCGALAAPGGSILRPTPHESNAPWQQDHPATAVNGRGGKASEGQQRIGFLGSLLASGGQRQAKEEPASQGIGVGKARHRQLAAAARTTHHLLP